MDLVNLKNGTDTYQDESGETKTRDDYPWGLRINLDNETLKKLGVSMPAVGAEVMITARAVVKGTSVRDDGDEKYQNADVQITDMAIAPAQAERQKSAADTLYGGDE
ncbi:capsid staple protein [Cronobacter malonaticus]